MTLKRCATMALIVGSTLMFVSEAAAQTRPLFTIRGFGDIASESFTAKDSFDAIFGTSTSTLFGGGVEAVERHNIFVNVRASRFRETGERVFRHNGELFRLGIPATVTITPVELTGGYRFDFGWRVVPYGGAGIGWHRYKETSRFATADENVDERFRGYHVVAGAEVRLWRWIGAAGEVQWTTVPDAIGQDANGIAREFNEDDLGGTTMRFKFVIGR